MKRQEHKGEGREHTIWAGQPGPWQSEPDAVTWQDPASGLPCMILRHMRLGHWCGYVGVQPGHPRFEIKHEDENLDLAAHGGVNWSNPMPEWAQLRPETPFEGYWWFGFDCSHFMDLVPGLLAVRPRLASPVLGGMAENYRDTHFAETATTYLAAQLIWTPPVRRIKRRRPLILGRKRNLRRILGEN